MTKTNTSGAADANYHLIDRFLRNNLYDDDYAEYSAALDALVSAAARGFRDGLAAAEAISAEPTPDELRAIAREARNSSGSASDDCGSAEYDICAIPGQHGPDHLCINCVSDYAAYPIVQVGTRLAEPQLQRVQREIDRFPIIPANNSYGPHTAEDWGVPATIPLVIVAAALTVAGVVLALLSWATGWPL